MDEHNRVLKHAETFAVFDSFGNIQRIGLGEQGIYHDGTRHLSRFDLRIHGRRPLLLSSTVKEDNALLAVDLTNPDYLVDGQVVLPRNQVHFFRCTFLWNGASYEKLRLRNYSLSPVEIRFSFQFAADFADIFEVRGLKRERRGEMQPPVVREDRVELSYRGLDNVVRRTTVGFSPTPQLIHADSAEFHEILPAHSEKSWYITVLCNVPHAVIEPDGYARAMDAAAEEAHSFRSLDAGIHTANEQFNDWLQRSSADLYLMVSPTRHGFYPYAGVPWFSTVFGRDGIITAFEYLWVNPLLAKGVLGYLAAHQATTSNAEQDADPGKILHETRRGEMAALQEIPFGCYYGSVDATPLFVALAGAYYERTADLDFIKAIWPNVRAALNWIDAYGDLDHDGFVEYARRSAHGLVTQGWKDSFDSVFHADGAIAEGPIALCEVQGYVYAAKRAGAQLAELLGDRVFADKLYEQSEQLRQRFEDEFWCEELSTYALALDGAKQPCRVRTSNPGHCLFTGIVSRERAKRVAATLLNETSFSGWGVRTVATTEARYNSMSYHNGSVWPHDNAILAAGLARYGFSNQVMAIANGLYDMSRFVDLHRMPELLCGFPRRPGEGPTLYPVACAPQSWAAGTVFLLLQSLLGLTIDAPRRQIRFTRPVMPESIDRMWIRNLRVGDASVDLSIERFSSDVGVELLGRHGELEIITVK